MYQLLQDSVLVLRLLQEPQVPRQPQRSQAHQKKASLPPKSCATAVMVARWVMADKAAPSAPANAVRSVSVSPAASSPPSDAWLLLSCTKARWAHPKSSVTPPETTPSK